MLSVGSGDCWNAPWGSSPTVLVKGTPGTGLDSIVMVGINGMGACKDLRVILIGGVDLDVRYPSV